MSNTLEIKKQNTSAILFSCHEFNSAELLKAESANDIHRFLCFHGGNSVIKFDDGSEREPADGAICYIKPNTAYEITINSVDDTVSGIACSGELIENFASACGAYDACIISRRPTAIDAYNDVFEHIEGFDSSDEGLNRIAMLFYKLFIELVYAQSHVVETKPAMIAQNIRQYIEDNIDTDISVTSIAKQFYLSETHVIRVFREKYGITPKQFILKAKIDASKLMLLDTSLQIKEIAMTYHFADSYHFSHTFKRFTGVSPEKFRMREDERNKN